MENGKASTASDLSKIAFGLVVIVAVLSNGALDPTPISLVWPVDGIRNWFGLPGALFAGFLIDAFGWCALVIPFFMIFLRRNRPLSVWKVFLQDALTIILLVILISLFFPKGDQNLVEYTGFLGYVSNTSLISFPGRLLCLLFLVGYIFKYISNYGINPLFFLILYQAVRLLLLSLRKLGSKTIVYGRQLFKSLGIFGLTPIRSAGASVFEDLTRRLGSRFQQYKDGFLTVGPVGKIRNISFNMRQRRTPGARPDDETIVSTVSEETESGFDTRGLLHEALSEYEKLYGHESSASPIIKP
ncbi:MAG: hypothetical protein GY866_25400 [Proteobacteria bacterium]|nr:hypothetical protein [Pseudomonadota bacterium]